MKSKLVIVLIISFLMGNATFSQDQQFGVSHTRIVSHDFDPGKVYNKKSGAKISLDEFNKLMRENPKVNLEREYDDSGNVIRYLYDPNNQNGNNTGASNSTVAEKSAFPNFKVTTIDRLKIELKNLAGKLVILRFEFEAVGFRFKKQEIVELDNKINALNNKEGVEAIVFFVCDKKEVQSGFDLAGSNFKLVANGYNFADKYNIHRFPTTLLIDQNGHLIENYTESGDINLEQFLSK